MTAQWIPPYGAAELKTGYNRNLALALFLSIGFHLLLLGLYVLTVASDVPRDLPRLPGRTEWEFETPRKKVEGPAGQEPRQNGGQMPPPTDLSDVMRPKVNMPDDTSDTRAMPLTIPGPVIPSDTSTGNGGGGGPRREGLPRDTGSGPPRFQVPPRNNDTELPPTEFVPVEEEAECDMTDLQSRISYPEIARRNGIEGEVVVRALVGRDGRVLKVLIDQSDSKVFEEAALTAVMKTPFKPAIQNKVPVAMWVQVPVSFRLSGR